MLFLFRVPQSACSTICLAAATPFGTRFQGTRCFAFGSARTARRSTLRQGSANSRARRIRVRLGRPVGGRARGLFCIALRSAVLYESVELHAVSKPDLALPHRGRSGVVDAGLGAPAQGPAGSPVAWGIELITSTNARASIDAPELSEILRFPCLLGL